MKINDLQALITDTNSISLSNSIELYRSAKPGLPLLVIDSPLCNAVLSPYGAQLLEFKSKGKAPLLWLSPKAVFEQGVPIRGGIPICAPWFGPHPTDSHKPNHGFLRNNHWAVESVEEFSNGEVKLDFLFDTQNTETKTYDYYFQIKLSMTLGESVKLALTVVNVGDAEMPFSWAFHTYFAINNLDATRVTGLTGEEYLDQTKALSTCSQVDDITFTNEVDRVYQEVGEEQSIRCDREGTVIANIKGHSCPSAIVWNPQTELAAKMKDIGPNGHLQFVCVERGAVFNDIWRIKPMSSMTAGLILQ
ncbi:hypothetical protein A9Q99_08815 [Gammaproteobacteria bacterium 45_16_T64]|nr:hypothetical protein A9Q99_08815 [Gammaproteobacteria bacterium 45_16_T64]